MGVDNLLLEIQKAVNCGFLSDLHFIHISTDVVRKYYIMQIRSDAYSLEEWNQAASYILAKKCCFKTVEEVKYNILECR